MEVIGSVGGSFAPLLRLKKRQSSRLLKSPLRAQSFRLVRNLGALLKVYVHPSKKRNNECGPAWKTRRARPEGPICCALSLGKGTTLSIATKHNSCTLQATLSTQGAFQQPARHEERCLVALNERFVTTSGAFSGATRRAGPLFPLSSVGGRLHRIIMPHSLRLAERKNELQQRCE